MAGTPGASSEVSKPVAVPAALPQPAAAWRSTSTSWLEVGRTGGPTIRSKGQRQLHHILESRIFKVLIGTSVCVAIFGGSLAVICNVPDDPGVLVQDAVMSCVAALFIVEMVLRCGRDGSNYILTFFFLLDLLGTASMVFELSYLLGPAGKIHRQDTGVDAVLSRTARAAKLAARAGRLTKLIKWMALFQRSMGIETFGDDDADEPGPNGRFLEARVLHRRLARSISTKVSMLCIVLVLGVPLFGIGRYPTEDMSLKAWQQALERAYAQSFDELAQPSPGNSTTGTFARSVEELLRFYEQSRYAPYRIDGYGEDVLIDGQQATIPGEALVRGHEPSRRENIVWVTVQTCLVARPHCEGDDRAGMYVDFEEVNRFEAGMDIALIVFVILCMVCESMAITLDIETLILRPVERMQGTVRQMALILSSVRTRTEETEPLGGEECDLGLETEAQMLERVFRKMSRLTVLFMQQSPLRGEDLRAMYREGKGVLVDIMGLAVSSSGMLRTPPPATAGPRSAPPGRLAAMPFSRQHVDSWDLDLLSQTDAAQRSVVTHIMFESEIGSRSGRAWIDAATFECFHGAVRGAYLDNPYHCYAHACDVVATVFRILNRIATADVLGDVEVFALLVSALSHDVGHPGKTNPFLLEVAHELAVRYNDKSPLENMHCARLFEICGDSAANVFKNMVQDTYKHARKICIEAILHTDNAQHFDMVKDVKKTYEVTSDICDAWAVDPEAMMSAYREEVIGRDPMLWMKLLLHLSDISTPLKPFHISRAWATRVQDEFFAQGDEEKRLGLPVGMLNDRDKVSRSGSEHGFINFLAAPLVYATVGIFPQLHHLAAQMASNVEQWRNLWVSDAAPSQEDVQKRDADIRKIKDKVEELRERKPNPTWRNSGARRNSGTSSL